jgi:phage-related tail protein
MANSIDLIVSKEAQAGLDALYKSLTKTHEEVVAISKLQLSFNGGQSPKSVTDLNEKIKDQAKIQAQLEKQIERNRLAEIRLQQTREKAFDKYTAQLQKEEAKLKASESVYNKIQNSMNLLQKSYKDLAIRKELGSQLTDKEEKSLERLGKRIQDYDRALKAVDGQMGKYQRNVGNYAGAFNPLSNSINQLSREMPAFANSVQTGFMAISNNLPIFFDAMGGIINQNKELQKQGLPTQSVFKQLAASVFSLGTALSVGVTLLTLYGKDIVTFIGKLFDGGKQMQTISDQMNQITDARKKASESASTEISELDTLYKVSQDVSISIDQRREAVNKLQELYPNFLANISDENILNGKAESQYYKLRDAIMAKYMAQAIGDKLAENAKDSLEDYLSIQEKIQETETEIAKLRKSGKDLIIPGSREEKTQTIRISNNDLILAQERKLIILNKDKNNLKTQERQENSLLIKTMQEMLVQAKPLEIEDKKQISRTKEKTKLAKEKIKVDKEINRGTEEYFLSEISRLEKLRSSVATTTKEYESYNAQLELLNASLMYLRGGERLNMAGLVTGGKSEIEQLPISAKESLEQTSQYLQGFYDQFGSESGMPTLFKVMNKEIEGFGDNWKVTAVAMMEIGQELTNTLMKQSEARFNAEYARLEQQKNISIAFAGSSATAKSEIERQYEEKRKSIQRRQAQDEKKQAMFNIAINTAQAVMATLGKGGFFASPLSIAVAAIGAAQLAMVAAQEIPAFAEGGVHEGGRMLINDAKGSKFQETVITPDGKVRQFKGRNKVVDAPKGTQIFTPDQWSKQINNLLLKNNISPLQTNQTNGINKDDLESVFRKYSGSNEVAIDINENGFKKMISSNGRTREILNSRLTTKGRIV